MASAQFITDPFMGRPNPSRKKMIIASASSPLMGKVIVPEQQPEIDLDPINARITNLEKRLNSSDSVYRLSVQTQTLREKERREHLKSLQENLANFQKKINTIETNVGNAEGLVRQIVEEEMARYSQKTSSSRNSEKLAHSSELKYHSLQQMMLNESQRIYETIDSLNKKVTSLIERGRSDTQIKSVQKRISMLQQRQIEIISALKEE